MPECGQPDAPPHSVIPIESARLRKLAKRYVTDWMTYGTPTAVLRMNHPMTPELIRTIKDEFLKHGINW